MEYKEFDDIAYGLNNTLSDYEWFNEIPYKWRVHILDLKYQRSCYWDGRQSYLKVYESGEVVIRIKDRWEFGKINCFL